MAIKNATELYKLRMMGIELHGWTNIYGYNQSILENSTAPNSKLKKKKSNLIAYHHVHECIACDEWRTT